tara:strand:+ start:776 stop:2974 length:2199 start_codon:yes stop_codon:yes gene_type:complete
MNSFKNHTNEAQALKFFNLLPKKVRHTIKRYKHKDKYKGALLMIKHLRKDPDVISRGLTQARIQGIAADHFGLNPREFAKILNRQTRYEEAPPGMSDTVKKFKADGMDDDKAFSLAWSIYNKKNEINEAYTIAIDSDSEIDDLNYSSSEKKALKLLYAHLIANYDIDRPLIFDPNPDSQSARRQVKINSDLEGKGFNLIKVKADELDGEEITWGSDLPPLRFGYGSAQKKIDYTEFGIKNQAQYLEFCQSIGFFLKEKLTPDNYVSLLGDLTIRGDFKIREFIDDWQYFIDFSAADTEMQKEVILLVNGSFFYRQEINVKNPYLIWNGIQEYYNNLKSKENIDGDVKPNTADCVLIDDASGTGGLYKELAGKAMLKTSEKTGRLTCGKVSWYQISLKKVRGGAKLGKLTSLLKGKFDLTGMSNDELARIDDVYYAKHPQDEDIKYEEQFNQLLIEGFFGDAIAKVKQLGGDALKKLKSAVVNILKFTGGLFKSMTKLLKNEEKKHDKIIDKITNKFLKEEALMETNILLREKKKKPTKAMKLEAIVNQKDLNKAYKDVIMKAFNDVNVINDTPIAFIKESNKIEIKAGTISFLAGNVITFGMLNKITDEVKSKGIGFVNDLNKSMVMGDTNIPVVKVYGNASGADSEILTVSKINQTDPKIENKKIDLVKIHIKPHDKYWVINMFMFASMKGGIPKYHKIAFKKGGKGFNWDIEGSATYTADKITAFPMDKG